jgi:hypothetical protein
MIPVFRCVVIETIVSQYCGMFSAAGVARYVHFRELRTLEAWECRQARRSGKVIINGKTFQGKIGATASHSMFLAGGLDDKSNCEVGIISFPNGQTLGGQAAQGLYEITLREEFARLNKLTGSLTLTFGVQATAGDKSMVDSLEGTVVWEYDSMACPQTIVQLYRGDDEGLREPDQRVRGIHGCRGASGQGSGGRVGVGRVVHSVWTPSFQDPHQEH